VSLYLDPDKGGDVYDEPLNLRRLKDGRFQDAVFLGAAEGAA
jgi:hypothetical protein